MKISDKDGLVAVPQGLGLGIEIDDGPLSGSEWARRHAPAKESVDRAEHGQRR